MVVSVEFHEDFLPLPLSPTLPLQPMVTGRAGVVVGVGVGRRLQRSQSQCILLRLHGHFALFVLPG